MQREAFNIFGWQVYWYGVFFALGFLAAVIHWSFLSRREGRSAETASDLALWLMLGGVLGARLAYVVSAWDQFVQEPAAIFRLWEGGLIYYGGLFGCIAAGVLYARLKKEPMLKLADYIITAVPLGHAFGRIGCYFNACCYGRPTEAFWAVKLRVTGEMVHPTQLLESGFNFLLYVVLLKLYLKNEVPGRIAAIYLMTYPVFRFLNEFLRGDNRMAAGQFDMAQSVSIGLFISGIACWFLTRPRKALDA
ncbi:MAG: phosphatidylglycerol:prolipoprotein diacylglycerol transferase [Candidatus Omnitrophota bacterium]|jgi:phosphatidylglycerol---prolipoprotein diacylglyceryl transferase